MSLHRSFYKNRFYFLLATQLLNFFLPELQSSFLNTIFNLLSVFIMMLSAANFMGEDKVSTRRSWFVYGFMNFILAVGLGIFPDYKWIAVLQYGSFLVFFGIIFIQLLQQLFRLPKVGADVVAAAFSGYLLLGLWCFLGMMIIQTLIPYSFAKGALPVIALSNSDMYYFSMTSLTTIGYGDITAVGFFSKKMAVITGALGQFYIAVVVAVLVSRMSIQQTHPGKK